ncbi:hypothetical protein WJX73_009577 [Symbiochloris irregularis]|uniref:Uncharacterized protein n=1 Tax=Symbiochloris irregularis TaxID=706552 RepID=A0AAW1P9B8_9CHLO
MRLAPATSSVLLQPCVPGFYPRPAHPTRATRQHQQITSVYVPDRAEVGSNAGPRLEQWTKTPADILALGPRATAGALSSFSQLQQDLQRLQALIQDPRPLEQKQNQLVEELQATLALYVERGASIEAEALQTLGRQLPEDLKSALPLEVRNALQGGTAPAVTSAYSPSTPAPATAPEPVGKSSLIDYQTAAEMTNVRSAVEGLRDAIARLASNTSPASEGVLELNLRERRDALSRSIQQLSPATLSKQAATVLAAVREASQLLAEVRQLDV